MRKKFRAWIYVGGEGSGPYKGWESKDFANVDDAKAYIEGKDSAHIMVKTKIGKTYAWLRMTW